MSGGPHARPSALGESGLTCVFFRAENGLPPPGLRPHLTPAMVQAVGGLAPADAGHLCRGHGCRGHRPRPVSDRRRAGPASRGAGRHTRRRRRVGAPFDE
ncbi:hypothetical protein ACFPM0_12875 [Pseudonocardia sulfidoxydans]|uniref:hypothetical protein n=1 Tax=Pseudonocardia sulfidoxydans TaxID=54011 RepID=UPI0036087CCF